MIELMIFGSTFMAVFALGFQSLNVNQGHYLAAAVTSAFISTGHIALYKFMPGADLVQLTAYYAGGVTGIVASMRAHAHTLGRRRLQDQAAAEKRIADVVLARLLVVQQQRHTDIH